MSKQLLEVIEIVELWQLLPTFVTASSGTF
jgi:hypothetical protein